MCGTACLLACQHRQFEIDLIEAKILTPSEDLSSYVPRHLSSRAWHAARRVEGVGLYAQGDYEGGHREDDPAVHDLRHTALTHDAAAGNPAVYVQARAGHAQATMTERYVHAAQVAFPGASEKAEERLFGAIGLGSPSSQTRGDGS